MQYNIIYLTLTPDTKEELVPLVYQLTGQQLKTLVDVLLDEIRFLKSKLPNYGENDRI